LDRNRRATSTGENQHPEEGKVKKTIALITAALFGGAVLLAPPATAGPRDDRLFYSLVTGEAYTLKAVSRKKLVSVAKETCKGLRSGLTILDIYEMMDDSGFRPNEISSFIAGAIVFYCPDQEDNF
jgi:hypothetical protein